MDAHNDVHAAGSASERPDHAVLGQLEGSHCIRLRPAYRNNGWHVPDGLVSHVLVGTPYDDRCRTPTVKLMVAPVDKAGRIGYGCEVARALEGTCQQGSVVQP